MARLQTLLRITMAVLMAPILLAQPQPLPDVLLSAKTAVVVNGGVDQAVYERLILELREWKRFEVVSAPADITITIMSENTIGTNGATGQPVRAIVYRLTFKQGETVLYSDALKGCCSLKAMTRKTLERLNKRMQAQPNR